VGNYAGVGGAQFNPTPTTGIAPAPDPLSSLALPTISGCTAFPGTSTVSQGTYCSIHITGGNVTFNPGTYIITGGGTAFQVNGNATLSGAGVTFILTTGAVQINGTATLNFSAPNSGTYEGILFFDNAPAGNDSKINGTANSILDGVLYFPHTKITFNGNSSSSGYTSIIADQVEFSGNANLGSNYSSLTDGSPIKSSALYE
jgi:hypothetical protein